MKFLLPILCFFVSFQAVARLDSDPLNFNESFQNTGKPPCAVKEAPSFTADPEICAHPEKVLCKNLPFAESKNFRDQIKSTPAQRAELAENFSKLMTSKSTRKEYIETCVRTEDKIYEQLSKQGITRDVVKARVKVIQEMLVLKIKSSTSFGKQKLVDAAVSRVESSNFRDAKSLINSEGFTDSLEVKSFYEECGSDGLEANAFYSGGEFTICPGYLISLVGSGQGVEALDLGIAHEVAHSFDPIIEAENTRQFFSDAYTDYLSCVDQNYGKQLTSPAVVLKNLERSLDDLKKEIKTSKVKDPKADLIFNLYKMVKGQLQSQWNDFSFYSMTAPVKTHSQELAADYFGTEVLAQTIAAAKPEDRIRILKNNLGPIPCDTLSNPVTQKFLGTKGDDGFHPPADLRIQFIVNHPAIWESLGCNKFGKPKTFCKLQ